MLPNRVPKQLTALRRRRQGVDAEAGQALTEVLAWSAVAVGAIVIIGGALQLLGVDIIGRIRELLGL